MIEAGEGSKGAGFDGGVGGGDGGGGAEFGRGLGRVAGSGEDKAEGYAGVGEGGVGGDGGAVVGFGLGGVVEGFFGVAEVEEDLRVVGRLGVEVGEELESERVVGLGEGFVGLLEEGRGGGRFGLGLGEVLGEVLGGEEERGKIDCCDGHGVPSSPTEIV